MTDEIVKVPDIGDATEVEVIEICVAAGDQVEKDATLIVLESDKASMEIPCPAVGQIKSIAVAVGDKVSEGDPILVIATAADVPPVERPAAQKAGGEAKPSAEASSVAATPVAQASAGVQEVRIPDIGDASDVEVIEIAVQVGDQVSKDDPLVVLESDKASMEIPSPQAGRVASISVNVGAKVSEGDLVLVLEAEGALNQSAATSIEEASTPEPVSSTKAETVTLKIPDIGDASGAQVIEIPVAVGDEVAVDDTLLVIESDKASMEVPANQAGVVKAILLEVGQQVKQDMPMLVLAPKGVAVAAPNAMATPASSALAEQSAAPTLPAKTSANEVKTPKAGAMVYAGPAVRMLARELGVDLTQVTATGPRGRILKEDVQNFVKRALSERHAPAAKGAGIPEVPVIDFSRFGEISLKPMSRIQKLTATAMHRSWLNVPHVTHFDEADITDLEEFRALKKQQASERGLKLTPLPFLLKACAAALKLYPQFNASLAASGEEIIYKKYCHIGVAMDTPGGLVVPVIRNVDKKGVWDLAEEAKLLGEKGQAGKLSKDDLQGGCFTISSLGAIGGTGFTPIVNSPEVGILGVSKSQIKPVFRNNEFEPRTMLPLALSYDHRAINGVDAGNFMCFLTQVLSDIRKLVL